jgi:hypothetical protein
MVSYDERAVSYVKKLERALPPKARLDPDHVEFGALFNALECHIEAGRGHPDVVQSYQQVLVTLASVRGVAEKRVTKATKIFAELTHYLGETSSRG